MKKNFYLSELKFSKGFLFIKLRGLGMESLYKFEFISSINNLR